MQYTAINLLQKQLPKWLIDIKIETIIKFIEVYQINSCDKPIIWIAVAYLTSELNSVIRIILNTAYLPIVSIQYKINTPFSILLL